MNFLGQKGYFDGSVSNGFVSLYTGKTIIMIASGLLGLFLPIFLYNIFDWDFKYVVIFYGISSIVYVFTIALGVRFLNTFGFRRALRLSVVLGALFYAIFYFANQNNIWQLIPLSIFTLTLFRLSYWVPFHVDFAKFTDSKNRGREISLLYATSTVLGIFVPAMAGFIINRFNYDALFLLAVILFLVSGIPYLAVPRTEEKFSWGYMETWQKLGSFIKKKALIAQIANGAESLVGIVVWPIFIFQLLKGNYLQVGMVSSFIIGFSVLLQLIAGKVIDTKIKKEDLLGVGSVLYAFGWITKIFIDTAFQIFIAGTYHSFAKIFLRTPFDTLTYEIAADEGHYVDEFTVIKEMAIHIGRALMAIIIIGISFILDIQWVFLLAAFASLLFSLLGKKDVELIPERLHNI